MAGERSMSTQAISKCLSGGRVIGCVAVIAAGATAAALAVIQQRMVTKRSKAVAQETMILADLPRGHVPQQLRPEFYFDFASHPFSHSSLLTEAHDVVAVLESIPKYVVSWIERHSKAIGCSSTASTAAPGAKCVGAPPPVHVEKGVTFAPNVVIGPIAVSTLAPGLHVCEGCQVLGGIFDLRSGGIWLGAGATVEPGAYVSGPTIIGRGTVLRSGAYVRGSVIVGDGAVLRGELKNVVIMDKAELAHPGYCGDSIIGYKGHFGCQALTANLGLFGAELSVQLVDAERRVRYRLGRTKIGLVLGDGSQLGCNSVSDPGTFLAPRTHVYPLSRLASGFYGPDAIVKNKPAELGVLVTEPLRS